MDKKSLTEADIRTKFITPALVGTDGGKWDVMTQLRLDGLAGEPVEPQDWLRGSSPPKPSVKKPS